MCSAIGILKVAFNHFNKVSEREAHLRQFFSACTSKAEGTDFFKTTMADQVHYELEKMLPELVDLEERQVFSKAEISAISKKRKELEYKIHRKIRC